MFTYICVYNHKTIEVQAPTTYEAQKLAAAQLKVKKSYLVSVFRKDKSINTASI